MARSGDAAKARRRLRYRARDCDFVERQRLYSLGDHPRHLVVGLRHLLRDSVLVTRDNQLDRDDVALKILPQAFTVDPGRLARFEYWAQGPKMTA